MRKRQTSLRLSSMGSLYPDAVEYDPRFPRNLRLVNGNGVEGWGVPGRLVKMGSQHSMTSLRIASGTRSPL